MPAVRLPHCEAVTPCRPSEARQATGLSQAQFAALLGVSVRTLQGWEQGRKPPSGAARTLLATSQSACGAGSVLDVANHATSTSTPPASSSEATIRPMGLATGTVVNGKVVVEGVTDAEGTQVVVIIG